MKKTIPSIIISLTLFLLSGCKGEKIVKKASSSSGSISSNSIPARWSSSKLASPLNVVISDAFNSDFSSGDIDSDGHGPIKQMMKLWNNASSSWTFFNLDQSTVSNIEYTNLTDYYYVDSSQFGIHKSYSWFSDISTNALAVTQYYGNRRYSSTGTEYVEINHADIVLNYAQHSFSVDRYDYSAFDLPTVILHELGHLLGLGHYGHSYAVMAPSISSYEVKRDLFYDQANIVELYNSNNLTAKSLVTKSSDTLTPTFRKGEGDIVRGVIELSSDGECLHYQDGQLINKHRTKLHNYSLKR